MVEIDSHPSTVMEPAPLETLGQILSCCPPGTRMRYFAWCRDVHGEARLENVRRVLKNVRDRGRKR